jgi:hypothetical protein
VFLRYGAEQECSGYLFVLGVIPDARDKTVTWALALVITHKTKRSFGASFSFMFCLWLRFRSEGRSVGECGCAVMHGVPGAYAPGSAEISPSGLVRASVAKCGFLNLVWASGPRCVGSACSRLRFRPEGPFSGSPRRSPGDCGPQKNLCLRPVWRISRRACLRGLSRGRPVGAEVPSSVHATPEIS